MPSLSDYFLPAKSPWADAPVSGDVRYYTAIFTQLEGVVTMLNERRAAVGAVLYVLPSATHYAHTAALLNTVRAQVEDIIHNFLDDTVHADGSLEGHSDATVRFWNLATIMAAVGVGDGNGLWTVVPARNPFGAPASYGNTAAAFRGKLMYKEHINELIQVLDRLRYTFVGTTLTQRAFRSGTHIAPQDTETCTDAKTGAIEEWNEEGWTEVADGVQSTSAQPQRWEETSRGNIGSTPSYIATVHNGRGKVKADLSFTPTGSAQCFLKVTNAKIFQSGTPLGNLGHTPPTDQTNSDNYGLWSEATPTLGGEWVSQYITNSDVMASFTSNCPTTAVANGWSIGTGINSVVVVVTPTFLYNI